MMSPTKISGPVMICIVIISVISSTAVCQTDSETETSTGSAKEVTIVSATVKPPVNVSCEAHSNDCKSCVSNSDCYYCETDGICYFKLTKVLTSDKCNLKEIRYLTCEGRETETSTGSAKEVTLVSTTVKPPVNVSCEAHNNDCKGCVSNSDCYYCETDGICYFKITKVLTGDKCNLKKIHYLTCRVNFQYLMIIIGVFAGIALLIVTICCCYCCCKRRGIKISKDNLKWARQREERKEIAAERRKERAERTEEIRKKYGLVKDSNPYQRFDA